MNETQSDQLILPQDVDSAISALAALGSRSTAVAGGTWVMRGPTRLEPSNKVFVSLSRIDALHKIELNDDTLSIGCLVTHEGLARAIGSASDLVGLSQAANNSANPAIRRMATVGGNICAADFHAADLVPALISLDAMVEVQRSDGAEQMPIDDFIVRRGGHSVPELLTKITVRRADRICAHTRMTLRKAGEYSIANLSISVELDRQGIIKVARIAVGAVEEAAKRWFNLEADIVGYSLAEIQIGPLAKSHMSDFTPRDGSDAPGWYRLRILSSLAQRAIEDLKVQLGRGREA